MNTITEKQFKQLINDTIVVQFSAGWCGPCKTLTKLIEANEDKLGRPISVSYTHLTLPTICSV